MALAESRVKTLLDILTVVPPSRVSPGARAHIREIRELLVTPEVVGIGMGDRAGSSSGNVALRIYVHTKSSDTTLRLGELLPRAAALLRQRLDAIPIDFVRLRELTTVASGGAFAPHSATQPPLRNAVWLPPAVQPGYAIKHARGLAGTLGAVVKDRRGRLLALSNCHVLALGGAARVGDEIDYPGHPEPVGRLVRFIPLRQGVRYSNLVDAAIASFSHSALTRLDPRLRTLGFLPAGVSAAVRGMTVVKVGLDGMESESRVVDVNFRAVFDSGSERFGFCDQILCHPRLGEDGDSGALIIERRTRRAVGLNLAGTTDLGGSVCCPLRPALAALAVSLLTTQACSPPHP